MPVSGPRILATSFVTDRKSDGTIFPAAGGNSADARVQSVYWRCIVVLYASARINDPDLELRFYTNCEPPELDGRRVRDILDGFGVSTIILPLTHRFTDNRSRSWGNVLYFMDVMASLAAEPGDRALALVDSDVVMTGPVDALFTPLDRYDFVGYGVERPADEDINGLDRNAMTALAAGLFGRAFPAPVLDFGGELLVTTADAWRRHGPLFEDLYRQALAGGERMGRISTEEHFYSIIFAGLNGVVARDTGVLKRLWTARTFSTVEPGDERYALWHLPAEKRYGLRYLYQALRARRFATDIPAPQFRAMAQTACGIPRAGPGKRLRDGWEQVRRKLAG